MTLPVANINWRTWRLVPSRFPPVGVFDRVASQDDLDVVMRIEGMTNDRLRQEAGDLSLVPRSERVFGPGTTPIMAAFTHLNPSGSRFSDGTYGVYYAAKSLDTAIAETRYHRERFLKATKQPAIETDMRSYASNINAELHDLRGQRESMPEVYDPDPDKYGAAQALAKSLRAKNANGIVYDSVRDPNGVCIAAFRPKIISNAVQSKHFCYVWDGKKINVIYEKRRYQGSSNTTQ